MALKHRRRWDRGDNDWHFHPECSDWPSVNYNERTDQPAEEELCQQCLALWSREKYYPYPRSA